ncbi:MAG: pyridoxamine 5'-phosphate oxidase family protein [Candidatus Izemoplasmatales bacterium]|nr:pyridoxamine 5'-phosphate oxidase family protein [Candidatus Izemoplasmatales bacterium]
MTFRPMRRNDKLMSETETLSLLKNSQEGVLGTISENGYPYTVVVNYVYHNDKIYFHSAKTGHKIDNINFSDKVSFTVYTDVKVLGEELNTLYKSLTLFGKAKVVEATEEVLWELIKKYSKLSEDKAKQMIAKEIDITAVIEIEIEHLTGKYGK